MLKDYANTIISSDLCRVLDRQVHTIASQITKKKKELSEVTLLGGKAGIVLLFSYLAKLFPEKAYLNDTLDYLEELSNSLANDPLAYSMSTGVAGIAFTFQHLRNIGILDRSGDLNLEEL